MTTAEALTSSARSASRAGDAGDNGAGRLSREHQNCGRAGLGLSRNFGDAGVAPLQLPNQQTL